MSKLKLNLGSGLKRYDGFTNVDHDPLVNPDVLLSMGDNKLPFDDNSVSEIKAYHIFEHIPHNDFLHLMKELYRILEDGGIVDVELPHHKHDEFFGDPTHVHPFTVETFRLFSKKYNLWHMDHFGSSTGFGLKCDVDFEIVEYDHVFDDFFIPLLQEMKDDVQREAFIRTSWNVIKYLKIKIQAVK